MAVSVFYIPAQFFFVAVACDIYTFITYKYHYCIIGFQIFSY